MNENKKNALLKGLMRIESLRINYEKNSDNLSDSGKFLLLKEIIISCFELTPEKFLENHFLQKGIANSELAQFARALRHLLVHFPFFNTAEDIIFDYDLISIINGKGSMIIKYLTIPSKKPSMLRFEYSNGESVFGEFCIPNNFGPGKALQLFDLMDIKYPNNSCNNILVLVGLISISLFQEYIRSLEKSYFPTKIIWGND